MSSDSDAAEPFAHDGPKRRREDALLRALVPAAPSSASSQGALRRSTSMESLLAQAAAGVTARARTHSSTALSEQADIARQFRVARSMAEGQAGWAVDWARANHPERCKTPQGTDHFLRKVRRWASSQGGPTGEAGASSQGPRLPGAGVSGVCTTMVPPTRRRRPLGSGGPGSMKCPELGSELFSWFVDSVRNVRGRLPSALLLDVARVFAKDLVSWHAEQKEVGQVPPHAALALPVLNTAWLRRWRRLHGISWRTVNLRFKCPRSVLKARLEVFWGNVLRVRFLHRGVEPRGELVFEGFDQKPLWFTASSQEKTLGLRGARKVVVKENLPMTRARFTAMTRCRWPTPPTDGKEIAVLFKAAGGGARVRAHLRVPPGVLLQFQEKGSYRLEDVLEYLDWILDRSRLAPSEDKDASEMAKASSQAKDALPGRRVVYMLDWFAPHLDARVDDLVHSVGHAVLRIGGHLTGLVQVEDTHCHASMAAAYRRREMQEAHEQLRIRPDQLPSTSRQTVLDRALDAWLSVDHVASSQGFIANGIANALDGSQDDLLSLDVADLWVEIGMPRIRAQIEKEVAEALRQGVVTRFEDYPKLLKSYDAHAPLMEGQEAFDARMAGDDGADEATSGSGTPPDAASAADSDDDDGAPHPPAPPGASAPVAASSHEPAMPAEALSHDAPAAADKVSSQDDLVVEHPLSKQAAKDLAGRASASIAATEAALAAAVAAGGDKGLETSLRERLRMLRKRAATVGAESRIHLHAVQMDRREQVLAQRVESKAREAAAKELALTVKLRQAEAAVAAAKGREAAAEARKKVEEAKAQKTEDDRLRAKQAQVEDQTRLFFAAHLVRRLDLYLRDPTSGEERRKRIESCAAGAAKRKMGLVRIDVPRFWTPTTTALMDLTPPARLGKRLRAKTEVHWASPEFSWALFGRPGRSGHTAADDPPYALRRLIERTMPGYFNVLGARYGVPALLAESLGIMDLAFLAANYRFTQVVGWKMYRAGLSEWPDNEWLGAKGTGSAGGTTSGLEPSASGAPHAAASAAGSIAAGSSEVSAVSAPPRAGHAPPTAAASAASAAALAAFTASLAGSKTARIIHIVLFSTVSLSSLVLRAGALPSLKP